MIGVQGSGKSTWARENAERLGAAVIASDEIRNELEALGIDATDEGDRVFAEVEARMDALLAQGRDVMVDATHALKAWRAKETAIARRRGARLVAIWFDVPLEASLAHNAARPGGGWGDRVVPADVIRGWHAAFEPPTAGEFDEIIRLS